MNLLREQGFYLEFPVYMGCVEGWDAKVRNLAGEKGVLIQERIISSPADALEFSNFMAIKPGSYRQVAPMILVDDSVNIPGYLGVVAIPNGLDTKLQKTPRGGVILENGDLRLYFGSPVYSPPGIRGEEAFSSSFQSLSADLFLVNLEVQDLTRIWLFLSALYSDYGSLNMARKKYYDRSLPLKGRRIPASTGIAGKNIYGSAVAAQCWAFSGKKIEIKRSFSPMQCEPSAYGVLFSRAIRVDFPENRLLLVSGTASIDAVGRTVHEGNPEDQIVHTIRVIAALLSKEGGTLDNIVQGVIYIKKQEFAKVCLEVAERERFPVSRSIVQFTDICRGDLLCEIEAIAVFPKSQQAGDLDA